MTWKVIYHPNVEDDLKGLGKKLANRVLDVIEQRIINGDPAAVGKPLGRELAGLRRIRTGPVRIVYEVRKNWVVLVIVAGWRRDNEVYEEAAKRK